MSSLPELRRAGLEVAPTTITMMPRPSDLRDYDGGEYESAPAVSEIRWTKLFGRDGETDLLRRILEHVRDADGGAAVLLGGESGAGKSALADWALAEAEVLGFQVVRATCEPFHAGMSFFPIQELTRKLAGEQTIEATIAADYGADATETLVARRASLDESDRYPS